MTFVKIRNCGSLHWMDARTKRRSWLRRVPMSTQLLTWYVWLVINKSLTVIDRVVFTCSWCRQPVGYHFVILGISTSSVPRSFSLFISLVKAEMHISRITWEMRHEVLLRGVIAVIFQQVLSLYIDIAYYDWFIYCCLNVPQNYYFYFEDGIRCGLNFSNLDLCSARMYGHSIIGPAPLESKFKVVL